MKLLLYCTKAKPRLVYRQWTSTLNQIGIDNSFEGFLCGSEKSVGINELGECEQLNGKIVAECDFEIEEISEDNFEDARDGYVEHFYTLKSYDDFDEGQKVLLKESCLQKHELSNYLGFENGYAVYIENLHIFDKPKELSEYYTRINDKDRMNDFKGIDVISHDVQIDERLYECVSCKKLEKAPRNMMKVWEDQESPRVLISIRPQWLVKILNGEKTIEVRKKVLKEMIK